MKTLHRFTTAAACATALTMACGAKTSGGGGSGNGSTPTSACDDYFQTVLSSCPADGFVNPAEPPSGIQHVQGRWETLCAEVLALPGTSVTASALENCVSDLKMNGCAALDNSTGPCTTLGGAGTLPGGSSCAIDDQCEEGVCTTGTLSPDGGTTLCGICATPPAPGQSCADGQSCGPTAECFDNVCTTITHGGVGASCTAIATQCNEGLACDLTTGKCAAPGGPGTPCEDSSECISPLICPQPSPVSGPQVCAAPAQIGGACLDQADCALGLTCDQTSKCATISFVGAGEACNENTIQCLVGNCNALNGNAGTCPTVIADGQPCLEGDPATTCDVFANCEGGVCVFAVSACP